MIRRIIRGACRPDQFGAYEGWPVLIIQIAIGATLGGYFGAFVMALFHVPPYLIECYERGGP